MADLGRRSLYRSRRRHLSDYLLISIMACSVQIFNRKVALVLTALSIYGLLLVFVSSDNMNPKFLITNFKNRYMAVFDVGRNNVTELQKGNLTDRMVIDHIINAGPRMVRINSSAADTKAGRAVPKAGSSILAQKLLSSTSRKIFNANEATTTRRTESSMGWIKGSLSNMKNNNSVGNSLAGVLVGKGTEVGVAASIGTSSTTTTTATTTTSTTTSTTTPTPTTTTTTTTTTPPPTTTRATTTPTTTTTTKTILTKAPPAQPLVTLFTTFRNSPDKTHIYKNTIRNWRLLSPWVKPILYTISGELDMTQFAKENGWDVLPVPKTSRSGVPILRHMFLDAQTRYNTTFYGYVNGDILFTEGIVDTLKSLVPSLPNMKQLLVVGRRTNFQLKSHQNITTLVEVKQFGKKGQLFTTNAQDYFISTRNGYPWSSIPDFVVGRVGYDNWLVVTALVKRMFTIDTTKTVLALHQTGVDGNFAGHRKKPKGDTYINYGLAGRKFDYSLGHVSCGQFYTEGLKEGIKIVQRNKNGCERTFKRFHVSPYMTLKPKSRLLL